jgi:hypothetical protein
MAAQEARQRGHPGHPADEPPRGPSTVTMLTRRCVGADAGRPRSAHPTPPPTRGPGRAPIGGTPRAPDRRRRRPVHRQGGGPEPGTSRPAHGPYTPPRHATTDERGDRRASQARGPPAPNVSTPRVAPDPHRDSIGPRYTAPGPLSAPHGRPPYRQRHGFHRPALYRVENLHPELVQGASPWTNLPLEHSTRPAQSADSLTDNVTGLTDRRRTGRRIFAL